MNEQIYKTIRIDVKTPKNKAVKSIESLRTSILMFRKNKILKQEIVSHNHFYWLLNTKDNIDYVEVVQNCAKAEYKIKKFYKILIKAIKIANRGISRFKFVSKAVLTIIKLKVYRFLKGKGMKDDQDLMKDIKKMPEEEFKEFIAPDGIEDIEKLISEDIITIKEHNPEGKENQGMSAMGINNMKYLEEGMK